MHVHPCACIQIYTACIADTQVCSVPWTATQERGLVSAMRGETPYYVNRDRVCGEYLVLRDCMGRSGTRANSQVGGMACPRHVQWHVQGTFCGAPIPLSTLYQGDEPLPASSAPTQRERETYHLQKEAQIKLTPDFCLATTYARKEQILVLKIPGCFPLSFLGRIQGQVLCPLLDWKVRERNSSVTLRRHLWLGLCV